MYLFYFGIYIYTNTWLMNLILMLNAHFAAWIYLLFNLSAVQVLCFSTVTSFCVLLQEDHLSEEKRYGLHSHIKSSINCQVAEIATLDNVYYIIFIHGYQINCLQCLLWVSKCVFPVKKIQNLFEFIWCLVSKLKKN